MKNGWNWLTVDTQSVHLGFGLHQGLWDWCTVATKGEPAAAIRSARRRCHGECLHPGPNSSSKLRFLWAPQCGWVGGRNTQREEEISEVTDEQALDDVLLQQPWLSPLCWQVSIKNNCRGLTLLPPLLFRPCFFSRSNTLPLLRLYRGHKMRAWQEGWSIVSILVIILPIDSRQGS